MAQQSYDKAFDILVDHLRDLVPNGERKLLELFYACYDKDNGSFRVSVQENYYMPKCLYALLV